MKRFITCKTISTYLRIELINFGYNDIVATYFQKLSHEKRWSVFMNSIWARLMIFFIKETKDYDILSTAGTFLNKQPFDGKSMWLPNTV